MSRPTVLYYDPANTLAVHLQPLCVIQKLRPRQVRDADLNSPLEALATGRDVPVPPVDLPLAEPVLVFCGLTNPQLDRMLVALRKRKVFCLKAVLTPSNAPWSFRDLYAELCREREKLEGQKT